MRGTDQIMTPHAAYVAWTEHPHFRYRGCAPDPDNPLRVLGNPELHLDAWTGTTEDGGEPQRVRRAREAAAIEVCLNCPVMVACDVYANTVTPEGKLAAPDEIRGGRTPLERHRRFIKLRHRVPVVEPAPVEQISTPQKLAVLRALAAHSDPEDVATAAGMDLRTANWQVSRLRSQLGLPATATRMQILEAARALGLLEGKPSRPRVKAPPRDQFTHVVGQLALWEAELAAELAPVHELFPVDSEPLEAAA